MKSHGVFGCFLLLNEKIKCQFWFLLIRFRHFSLWTDTVDGQEVKCWSVIRVRPWSCSSCVPLHVSGSGQTAQFSRAWRQRSVVFRLLAAPAVNPWGFWDMSASLSLPFKGCIHCKQALEKKIETATFFCELGGYGSRSGFDRNQAIYRERFCHEDVR